MDAGPSSAASSDDLLTFYESFFIRSDFLEFLQIGPLCNGSRSFPLTEAYCDLRKIESVRMRGTPLGIEMGDLFERGFNLLRRETLRTNSQHTASEIKALSTLRNFLLEIETHERHIFNALKKMEMEQSKETILSMALSEHLLSKLAPEQSYTIDARATDEGPNQTCRCGCGKRVNFGATGIGHSKVWHGYVDVILGETHQPVSAACVLADDRIFDKEDTEPTPTKRSKVTDEENIDLRQIPAGKSKSEVKPKIKGTQDQTVAQTIVFALAHKQLHRNVFVPNIVICPTKFCFVMYEPEKDVLVRSETFPLWNPIGISSSLRIPSVIALWMVLNYRTFCSGGDIFEDVNEVKANFQNCIEEESREFYQHLDIGRISFETEERVDYLDRTAAASIVDKPKLKKTGSSCSSSVLKQ